MRLRTALKVLGGAAVGVFVVAVARVDVEKERLERAARQRGDSFQWTDKNRWE